MNRNREELLTRLRYGIAVDKDRRTGVTSSVPALAKTNGQLKTAMKHSKAVLAKWQETAEAWGLDVMVPKDRNGL